MYRWPTSRETTIDTEGGGGQELFGTICRVGHHEARDIVHQLKTQKPSRQSGMSSQPNGSQLAIVPSRCESAPGGEKYIRVVATHHIKLKALSTKAPRAHLCKWGDKHSRLTKLHLQVSEGLATKKIKTIYNQLSSMEGITH